MTEEKNAAVHSEQAANGQRKRSRGQGELGYRLGRLWAAAEVRRVPLRTIIVAILAVAFFFLAGKLIYRLRDVLLLLLVAGFLALILNPLVRATERWLIKRHGLAVTVVALLMVLVFVGLSVAFGYPLVNGITHLANDLPTYVANAEQGKGWYGKLVQHYHVQQWVQQNSSKLVTFGQNLCAPALAVGKGALSLLIELLTIFILVLMLLLEGPRLRRGVLVAALARAGGGGAGGRVRGEPLGRRLHARELPDLDHLRRRGPRRPRRARRAVSPACGRCGSRSSTSCR